MYCSGNKGLLIAIAMRKIVCREPRSEFDFILCNRLTDERKEKTKVQHRKVKGKARKLSWMEHSMRIRWPIDQSSERVPLSKIVFYLLSAQMFLRKDCEQTNKNIHAILHNKIFSFFSSKTQQTNNMNNAP